MRYQASARAFWGLGSPIKALGLTACFLCVALNTPAANASPGAFSLQLALRQHAQAPRSVQMAADASGSQSAGGGQSEASYAPAQANAPDQKSGASGSGAIREVVSKAIRERSQQKAKAILSTFLGQNRINSVEQTVIPWRLRYHYCFEDCN